MQALRRGSMSRRPRGVALSACASRAAAAALPVALQAAAALASRLRFGTTASSHSISLLADRGLRRQATAGQAAAARRAFTRTVCSSPLQVAAVAPVITWAIELAAGMLGVQAAQVLLAAFQVQVRMGAPVAAVERKWRAARRPASTLPLAAGLA